MGRIGLGFFLLELSDFAGLDWLDWFFFCTRAGFFFVSRTSGLG